MTAHDYYKCPKPCPNQGGGYNCLYCDGGLGLCTVCGGGEGSLPTECPGSRMPEEIEQSVFAGTLNFRDGEWRRESHRNHYGPDPL